METARPKWRTRAWLDVGIVFLLAAILLATLSSENESVKQGIGYVTLAVIVGGLWVTIARIRRQRRVYEQKLADWATERAAQAERLRIAADLHDLVSHGLGAITVRAAAARSVEASGPEGLGERERALGDIETVSRETTTELRRMLTVLREPGTAPLRPADTLTDLPRIIADARAAGLDVGLEMGGVGDPPAASAAPGSPGVPGVLETPDGSSADPASAWGTALGAVSPGAQLTVCAVVREALANTLRHAGPSRTCVTVSREGTQITVRVRDDGPRGDWRAAPGAGHGLDGLRGRLATLGGDLETGPDGAGFSVLARIPETAS
ncbi:sensor histidine kinase [Leucobacter albus]|uniref:histidine kinase n=1 Tax=Leucobacter albus TaxID=272210 RepID=A0ABW3TR04_9MICO